MRECVCAYVQVHSVWVWVCFSPFVCCLQRACEATRITQSPRTDGLTLSDLDRHGGILQIRDRHASHLPAYIRVPGHTLSHS